MLQNGYERTDGMEDTLGDALVLVTGGSGFVGTYCILQLLQAGYRVRTTVRSFKREPEVRVMLKTGGVDAGEHLSFVAADLMSDEGWPEAVAGCDYVLHVASPFPANTSRHEDDLIIPEREGGELELATVNPVGIFGPALGTDFSTSIQIVQRLMNGSVPGIPRLTAGIVDVRDVADLHLRAMINPAAKGERFLAVSGDFMALREIAVFQRGYCLTGCYGS
jgi:nucleoside-diphosphate-sugar epimerase